RHFLMIRRPPRSTQGVSSAASDVYKRQPSDTNIQMVSFLLCGFIFEIRKSRGMNFLTSV
ncbi:hypothetical protein, partial [Staphylococcus aureus]